MFKKLFWYANKVFFLCVVLVRILFYCVVHPRKIKPLLFSLFSTINDFYQTSHGKLRDFSKTETFARIKDRFLFSQTNIFNIDHKVARPLESPVLATLVRFFNPDTIFEIGTYDGYTTLHFAVNSHDQCKIYTLDLPEDFDIHARDKIKDYAYDDLRVVELSMAHVNKRVYKGHAQQEKIKELFGDSMTFDFKDYYGKMDLVYIDGNHSYPYVKSDTEKAFKMLSPDGIIIWHDFDYIVHRDIFKYLNHLSETHKIYLIPNTRFAIYGKNFS